MLIQLQGWNKIRGGWTVFFGVLFFLFSQAGAVWAKESALSQASDMVLIPEGVFTMGSSEEDILWVAKEFFSESLDWYRDETPIRKVYLGTFLIDKYEVTNAEFMTFRDAVKGPPPKFMDNPKFNKPSQPVVGITWQEALDYCKWLGKRLPTEEEWEKAARGTDARYYPWGNEPNPANANVRGLEDGNYYTAPVGDYDEEGASPFGVFDLAGNVWEWTMDWYQPYEGNLHENDLYGTTLKVIKGGSWKSNLDLARSPIRGKAIPDQRTDFTGFRCARDS